MSILVSCACGKSYPIKEQFAGQRVQCPACQRILTVPGSGVLAPPPQPPALPVVAVSRPPAPPRKPKPEPVLDLTLADEPAAPAAPSSTNLALILALGFILFLGGAGAAVYFILREENPSNRTVASGNRDKETKDSGKQTDADKRRPEKKDSEKPPEKREPEKKDPPKKDPEDRPRPTEGPWIGHQSRILSVAFTRDGRALTASGGEVVRDGMRGLAGDTTVRVWDAGTGKELRRLDGFVAGLSAVAFDPTGKFAVTADVTDARAEGARPGDFDLRVLDLAEKRVVRVLKGHEKPATCAVFVSDGRQLLSGGRDARLRIWDIEAGTQIGDGFPHSGTINDVAVSADSKLAVTACGDRTVRAFNLVDRKQIKEFPRHEDIVWCVAISPDGKWAVSGGGGDYDPVLGQFTKGSEDYEIRLWDLAGGREVRRFRGHTDAVKCLAFSADGRRLLSGGQDKKVRLWHVATGRSLGVFDEPTDWVTTVAFFPDGRRSLSGGYDRTLRVWTLPPDVGDLAKRLLESKTDRVAALRAVADYGPEARDAVPAILKLLGDNDPAVKRAAMDALGKVGTAGKEHVDMLVPLLRDAGFPEGRQFALDALASLGGDAKPALTAVLGLLKERAPATRVKAIAIIAAIGVDARSAAYKPLLELLRDPDADVAKAAADALGKLGKPSKAELPTLTAFLDDTGEPVRRYALNAIADLGDDARPALPAILGVLDKDSSAPLRLLALDALLKVEKDGKALLAPLTKALQDPEPKLALKAAETLVALPPETGVLPAIIKAMEHDDPAVVKVADDALEKFAFAKEHVKLIDQGLQSKREAVRLRMLKAATALGADAAGAVPGLIALVKISTGETQTMAINLLGTIGPPAREAGPVLALFLKDADRKKRLAICGVLGKIGADDAKLGLPYLVGMLKLDKGTEDEVADMKAAHEAMVQIGQPAIDPLLKALDGDFAGGVPGTQLGAVKAVARLAAVQTITKIAEKTKMPFRRAIGPLVKVQREDQSPEMQAAVKAALKAVQREK